MTRRTGTPRRALIALAVSLALVMIVASACAARGGLDTAEDYGVPQASPAAPPAADGLQYGDGATGGASASRDASSEGGGAPAVDGSASKGAGPGERLVVRSKSMLVRVEDVEAAVDELRTLAKAHDGSVESLRLADDQIGPVYREDASSDGRALAGYVTIRVPVARFDAFVAAAARLGKVLRQSEDASDVTQQHVDLKARLENLRAEEDRLREMFDRATRVSDMLDVERELARVRGEAEAMEAQIESLEKQAALSTITVELVEPEPIVRPEGVDWGVADAFTEGLRAFVGTFNGIIVVAMGLAPLAILAALVVLAGRPLVRRARRRRAAARAAGGGVAEAPEEA